VRRNLLKTNVSGPRIQAIGDLDFVVCGLDFVVSGFDLLWPALLSLCAALLLLWGFDGGAEPVVRGQGPSLLTDPMVAVSCAQRRARLSLSYLAGIEPMFIQTEVTPNPATLKFLPGRTVMGEGTFEARDLDQAERSPLARALMQLPGVTGVFFANDFISVTKGEGEWQHLRPAVLGVVTEFYLSGEPLIAEGGADAITSGEFFDSKDAETVQAIKELIETRVRPAVAGDGGDITFKGYRDGIVYLNMKGACSGCPSSTATLRHGIENLLKHFLPDIQGVEQIAA
jgi:Fe-S cluster biogenesis protein NfuA